MLFFIIIMEKRVLVGSLVSKTSRQCTIRLVLYFVLIVGDLAIQAQSLTLVPNPDDGNGINSNQWVFWRSNIVQ